MSLSSELGAFAGKIDALYVPPDSAVLQSLAEIGRFATRHAIPLYAASEFALDYNALVAFVPDHHASGRSAARRALHAGFSTERALLDRGAENFEIRIDSAAAARLQVSLAPLRGRPNVRIRGGL
jgi:ABC-type uncharacterized transport system substrate-binding protein